MRAEKARLVSNLVMLARSGMDIASCIRALAGDVRDSRLKKKLSQLSVSLEAGERFSRSLERARLLPPHAIALIELGERSGRLTENLLLIAEQERKNQQFHSQLRSALLYPTLVISIAIIVGIGVALFILPKLADLFSQLGTDLPLLTRLLVEAGQTLKNTNPSAIAFALFGAGLLFAGFFAGSGGRASVVGLLMRLPGVGPLIRDIELARMGYVAGTLLSAGVPIVETLRSLADTATLERYRRFYNDCASAVERGDSLRSFFERHASNPSIPRPIQTMLVTAEQSGRLAESFSDIGRTFEEKIGEESKMLTVALEPILLVLVWIGVVFLALAVLLPIYNLIGAINR